MALSFEKAGALGLLCSCVVNKFISAFAESGWLGGGRGFFLRRAVEFGIQLDMQRSERDKTVQIAAATVFAMKIVKDTLVFFLARDGKAFDVPASFAGDN
jgi:hypothetical protein